MASNLFKITPAEMQTKIMPRNGAYSFLIDDTNGDLTNAEVDAIVSEQEEVVLGRLHQRYREMLRRIEGELVVRTATAGQTALQLSFYPVTNLKLYVNLHRTARDWNRRTPALAIDDDDVTVDENGAVTLGAGAALHLGDQVLAEYDHTGASLVANLRTKVMDFAAYEIAVRLGYTAEGEDGDRFTKWREAAEAYLADNPAFDQLDRIESIFATPRGDNQFDYVLNMKITGGMHDTLQS